MRQSVKRLLPWAKGKALVQVVLSHVASTARQLFHQLNLEVAVPVAVELIMQTALILMPISRAYAGGAPRRFAGAQAPVRFRRR